MVRHGSHDRLDRILCGRMQGVSLGEAGRAEVERVAGRLAAERVDALYSSPLERTRETAEAIGRRLALPVQLQPDLNELDFGEWTGQPLERLHRDPRWEPWNRQRSLNRPPGGESMGEAQMRAIRGVDAMCAAHPDGRIVAVSHSDIIKAVLAHYLGLTLDLYHRFEIDPASISTLVVGDWGVKVVRINEECRP